MDKFDENVAKFGEILAKFNKIHSLTKYENLSQVVKDSILPLKFLDFSPKVAIDVGSGAGFPAIFLAMKMPFCQWHLFEPNPKKSSFLSYVKVELSLQNVLVHSQKIQNCAKFRADLITSRALMKSGDLIEICKGFYDKDSKFLLYKGSSVEAELGNLKAQIWQEQNRNYVLISPEVQNTKKE